MKHAVLNLRYFTVYYNNKKEKNKINQMCYNSFFALAVSLSFT
jgi:hypothetical protein